MAGFSGGPILLISGDGKWGSGLVSEYKWGKYANEANNIYRNMLKLHNVIQLLVIINILFFLSKLTLFYSVLLHGI